MVLLELAENPMAKSDASGDVLLRGSTEGGEGHEKEKENVELHCTCCYGKR
jgi:hypothetical protein